MAEHRFVIVGYGRSFDHGGRRDVPPSSVGSKLAASFSGIANSRLRMTTQVTGLDLRVRVNGAPDRRPVAQAEQGSQQLQGEVQELAW